MTSNLATGTQTDPSLSCSAIPTEINAYVNTFMIVTGILIVGAIAGYGRRHKNDQRAFNSATFLGEIFLSVFVGMLIFSLAVYYDFLKLFGTSKELFISTFGVAFAVGIGAYSAPIVIAILEKSFQDWIAKKLGVTGEIHNENQP